MRLFSGMQTGCTGEAASFCTVIAGALRQAEEYENNLKESLKPGTIEHVVLASAAAVVVILALLLPDFFLFWIVASFLLYMVNPFVMFIPSGGGGSPLPNMKETLDYIRTLKEIGALKNTVTSNSSTIAEVFWNLFFINSQPLAPAFWLIYSVDIFIALAGAATGQFGLRVTLLVAVQSFAIIAYYAVIWQTKPYSPGFFRSIIDLRDDVRAGIRGGIRSTVTILFFIGVGTAIIGTLVIAAMLLPGLTFNRLMDLEKISLLQNLLPVVPLLLAQIFTVRYLQGKYSRTLLTGIVRERMDTLKNQVLPAAETLARRAESGGEDICEDLDELRQQFMRLSRYQPGRHCLGGAFTVYIILPNLRLIFAPMEKKAPDQ
ncbi:MAG: hypothetical protein PWP08_1845 [Methanofollis sp.]|nr:hypothetical protein [Methanofollis sp.]